MKTFGAAWRFMTIFPSLGKPGPDEGDLLLRSAWAFIPIGGILGLLVGGVSWLLACVLPVPVVAALAVTMLVMVTAGLHMDGLTDCGDGLISPGRPKEKCLAIMKDSRVGAHGAMALVLILITKFACLASAGSQWDVAAMAFLMPLAGRTGMLWTMRLPYARPEGGTGMVFTAGAGVIAFGGLVLAGAAYLVGGPERAVTVMAVWLVVSLGWAGYLKKRLGGATGDCMGAACELAETAAAIGYLVVIQMGV